MLLTPRPGAEAIGVLAARPERARLLLEGVRDGKVARSLLSPAHMNVLRQQGNREVRALAKGDGSFGFKVDHFDWGGEYYKKHGRMMPDNGREQISKHDAILFGSAGHPDIPDHITLWGLRLKICQGFDQYANVRPARLLPGIASPLRNAAGGVDVSLPVSLGLAAVVYLALLFAFPEPRYAFGPAGPRLVPAKEAAVPPVIDDPRASVHRAGRRSPAPAGVDAADR